MVLRVRSLLTYEPVVVPLNGGGSLRLRPGATAEDVPDGEIADNPKVEKLRRQGVIEVQEVETPKEPGGAESAGEEQPPAQAAEAPRRRPRGKAGATGQR